MQKKLKDGLMQLHGGECEDLSSDPQYIYKTLNVAKWAYSSSREAEIRKSLWLVGHHPSQKTPSPGSVTDPVSRVLGKQQ